MNKQTKKSEKRKTKGNSKTREEHSKSGDKLESNNENIDTKKNLDSVVETLKLGKRRGSRRSGSEKIDEDRKVSLGMASEPSTIAINNEISLSPSSSIKAVSSSFNSPAAATSPRLSTPNADGSDSSIVISNSRKTRRSAMRTRSSKDCPPASVIISTSVTISDANETSDIENSAVLSPSTTVSPNNQTNQLNATELDNGRSESASTVQITPELVSGGAQPSTPRTPSSPPDHSHGNSTPNPPTPGNTNANSMMSSSPQYVTITVDGDAGVGAEGVNSNSSYVTYVEGSNEHSNIYATAANGQPMSYPVYSVGESTAVYNTNATSTQYYSTSTTGPSTSYTQRRLPVRRKRVKRELFYGDDSDSDEQSLLDDNNDNGTSVPLITDEDLNRLAKMNMYPVASGALPTAGNAAFKSCPLTVQWLLENYETAEGVSLPRYTMYYHYLRHCADHKLDPVNAASFGKLIRSVFLGLRTRRLGTRGNSKYHYYGIRLKPNSTLNQLYDDGTPINGPNGYYTVNGRGTGVMGGSMPGAGGMDNHRQQPITNNNNNHMGKRMKVSKADGYDGSHLNGFQVHDPTASQFLGDHTRVLDNFPELDENMDLPEGILSDDIIIFRSLYKEHCESLLDALVNFQMANVESYWRTFWRSGGPNSLISGAQLEPQNYENLLPKQKLILLCTFKKVQDFIREADFRFYQNIVGFLLPDVLRPIPSSMTQAIRNFAKALEGWLTSAMAGFPQEIITMKVSVVSSLAQTLRRYTSLNHLAQAARAVLQNQNQIAQMLTDLNRVDFNNVEEQASWVCECESEVVQSLEQSFKGTLAQQQTLEQWATWLESVVERILRPHLTSPNFVHVARQFLLKWSFYSSLIIRDLTLRSAASFGSFHLLRLLYDEYMFYLVEHRVAKVTGVVPIAVIGKTKSQTIMKTEGGLLSDPSTADIMEVFAHTPNTNGTQGSTLGSTEHSISMSQNLTRNGVAELTGVENMDSANNASVEGSSSSLIQSSTAVISTHHNSNLNSSHIPSSIKLSPK